MPKIAAIQISMANGSERALKKAGHFLEAAAAKGARVACFPELVSWPWFLWEENEESFGLAEEFGGPVTGAIARLASKYSLWVVCPFFEKGADGHYYNSAALINPEGGLSGTYRKVHVPKLKFWEERYYFNPGGELPVFEVEGLKIGVQLGWDNFFPEGWRTLGLKGADVVFLPTAAAFASHERWLAMAVSHAIANGMYVIRVNRVGREEGLDFYGHSYCVKPDGELSTEPLGMNEGMLLVECDPAETVSARRTWPYLEGRRPELYGMVAADSEVSG